MNEKRGQSSITGTDIQIPFKYIIIHGSDMSRRSSEQRAVTKSINLLGLVFEAPEVETEGLHISFTESTYGRNSLEMVLDLGKRFGDIEIVGQVDWYERRPTAIGYSFSVGVSFMDMPAATRTILRDFLQQTKSLAR